MTQPYLQPPKPRALLRSRDNRVIGGVCGGAAEYLNMDPTLVRVLTVVLSLFTGVPLVLYLAALFVVPEADASSEGPDYPGVGPGGGYDAYPQYPYQYGQPDQAAPAYAPTPAPSPQVPPQPPFGAPSASDPVWGQEGPPWEQRQSEAPQQNLGWRPDPRAPGSGDQLR